MINPRYSMGDIVYTVSLITRHHKCPTCDSIVYDNDREILIGSGLIIGICIRLGETSHDSCEDEGVYYALDSDGHMSGYLREEDTLYSTEQEARLAGEQWAEEEKNDLQG